MKHSTQKKAIALFFHFFVSVSVLFFLVFFKLNFFVTFLIFLGLVIPLVTKLTKKVTGIDIMDTVFR